MTTTEEDGAGPLYARIHRELSNRIVKGLYPVGELMPTEVELATEFNASRSTIREALRSLTEDGYVERRQGMGTRVVTTQITSGYYQSFSSLEELFQVALDTYVVVLRRDPVVLDEALAQQVGGKAGETWIRVGCVRWTAPGGRAIGYIESYVPERWGNHTEAFGTFHGPFFGYLEEKTGLSIREVQQEIRAVDFPVDFSRLLGLPDGGPAMQLLRRYITDQGCLITSINWHPANQITYKMSIKRQKSGIGG